MTLTEFLLARIAEDEAVARAAEHVVGADLSDNREASWWVKDEHQRVYAGHWLPVVEGGGESMKNTAALPHIARHDPARVLAECEAKRVIVALSEHGCGDDYQRVQCALALPYADHPDYRDEWKP